MKRFRLANFLIAALVGLTTGASTTSIADDTEIYLGSTADQEAIQPNVLFILDTSGSMSVSVDSDGDRMDHMKAAFNEIMDSSNNINVGLMRFTDPGGPILWPVSDIDADAAAIEAGSGTSSFPVNVRVSSSANDSEEIREGSTAGTVTLADTALNLVEVSAGATVTQTISSVIDPLMKITKNTNEIEETTSLSVISGSFLNFQSDQRVGVRFESVPIPADDPPGTITVDDARIVFTAIQSDSSGPPTINITGELNTSPSSFATSGSNDLAPRPQTSASVTWQPGPWSFLEEGTDTTTLDLSAIVQEIIQLSGWPTSPTVGSGNPMVFIFDPSTSGGLRRATSFRGETTFQSSFPDLESPELQITYTQNLGGESSNVNQLIGLRFQEVAIPQGTTITSAVLEFFPSEIKADDIDVNITGEDISDSPAFTTATNDLSSRTKTTASVNWVETTDWDDVETVHQTADITTVIQEIVNRSDWCGNNALSLFLSENIDSADGPLNAFSFDGDSSRAPILRVNFDESAIASDACVVNTVTSRIASSSDDGMEVLSSGIMFTTEPTLFLLSSCFAGSTGCGANNGFRFSNIPVAQGSEIVSANLTFVASHSDGSAATFQFKTEAIDDAPTISNSPNNLTNRTTGPSSVSWTPDSVVLGDSITTVDISSIISDVIDRPGWVAGNSLMIINTDTSSGLRRFRSFDFADFTASEAPQLTIKVKGSSSTALTTVRQKLKGLVNELDHVGFTPIVDMLYEAAKYYRGESVDWGKQRGFANSSVSACSDPPHLCNGDSFTNDLVRKNTRISHQASWTGGTVNRPTGCTDANLNASQCAGESISGPAVYTSPITEACQANYIVLLTDGAANNNDSVGKITSEFGISCSGSTTGGETCGEELASFLNTEDQIPGLSGDQGIVTYTIGFDFSDSFLTDLALAGGGESFTASTGAELANVFQTIVTDILNRSTSFSTPTLSINAFNKLEDLKDVYFALFTPSDNKAWRGNVKRYQLCTSSSDGCTLGEILDANDNPAINVSDQRISDSALSFWSSGVDGAEIEVGGAAENVPNASSREVFTFHDLTEPLSNPIDEAIDLNVNEVIDSNSDGILDGLDGDSDHPDALADTQFLLGDDAGVLSSAERKSLIDWIRGVDVDDEDGDGNTTENRFVMSDPLHSSPVAITFGGDNEDPVTKLFFGTNDGGLRMVNAFNGIEEWIFYPQDMMRIQSELKTNNNGDHKYGLDGVPTAWIQDLNEDGIIVQSDGDFVRIIIGQRRGGQNYYAVDVTPSLAVTSPSETGSILPTLLWRIKGGSGDFPNLGQTWSRASLATIRTGLVDANETELTDVIAFGGGYDVTQDNGFFGPSASGNAVYIVNALTGELVFTISKDDPGVVDNLVYDEMDCPIPSEVTFFDSDGDGTEDRIYVGDLCGQVHRIDIRPNLLASQTGIRATAGLFALLSEQDQDSTLVADHRKIFFKPSLVQVLNTKFSTTARYDVVGVVTGRRDNPLNIDVTDRVYALRDYHVDKLTDLDDDGQPDADTYNTIQGPTAAAAGTLFDATAVIDDPTGTDLSNLQVSDGWYIDLTESGEKSLSKPDIISGVMLFTTYLPEGVFDVTSCSLSEGSGLLYAVDVLTGGVVFNFDDADGTDTLTLSDKTFTLGTGIPSSAVPIFQEEGITFLIGGGGGASTFNPNLALPRGRTYWYQQ